ncbi:hypothetical protein OWR29_45870 [Actinoplanes sp. Pm04-4]|uniref:protein acetyllysine N-acetyltransferase n=1 Tax=Paractinoplanes pyxinae TaxID=2997416 RepID=A0ABT4BFQ1_9ACTN|nr:Sir2 family NAD-dependent protein deacetylase [Actinoplanes pyxinae]MCY1145376.1 hypothetical protein [Actinoplanes pyxinae]
MDPRSTPAAALSTPAAELSAAAAKRAAAALIAGAERLVVFTGAGMSAESGVPTFRDALTGLWAQYDAQALATPEAFERTRRWSGAGTSGGASWSSGSTRTPATRRWPGGSAR